MIENFVHIGISDLKSLLFTLKMQKGIDFSDYALSSLKRRVENFMNRFHFKEIDELSHRVIKDEYFYELFLKDILVSTTEMFRDPEFWVELRKTVLFRLRRNDMIRIFLPECNSGEEFFSLLIMLKSEKILEKSEIVVSSLSQLSVEEIEKAAIENKKMELNIANFEKVYEKGNISAFFEEKGNVFKLKPELLFQSKIIQHDLFKDDLQGINHLILYRNKTIYYNPQQKIKALKILKEHLITGGYIALGIKEKLEYPGWEREFSVVNETEKIYKKLV